MLKIHEAGNQFPPIGCKQIKCQGGEMILTKKCELSLQQIVKEGYDHKIYAQMQHKQ